MVNQGCDLMENQSDVEVLSKDDLHLSLDQFCIEQQKVTLALEQLERTQSELLAFLSNSQATSSESGGGSLFSTISNLGGTIAFADAITGTRVSPWISAALGKPAAQIINLGSKALTAAEALAAIPAATAAGIIGLSATTFFVPLKILQYEMKQGWIERPNMDQMNETANAVDEIMAASNPFIYEGDNTPKPSDYIPAERGELFRQKYVKRQNARDNIAQITATLNAVGDIYAASNPHLYQPAATFDTWQTSQPHPGAAYGDWQQQQFQLSDTQAQIMQYWQTQSDNSKNEAVTLNVTNNFKGVTQDRRSLNDIASYLARQITDDLNAGRPLYSRNR